MPDPEFVKDELPCKDPDEVDEEQDKIASYSKQLLNLFGDAFPDSWEG